MDYSSMTPRQAAQVAKALGEDPSQVPVRCEAPGCTAVKPLGEMFSMAVVYRMPGAGKAPYQCSQEQHFGCSHNHAKSALLACLESHIEQGDHA